MVGTQRAWEAIVRLYRFKDRIGAILMFSRQYINTMLACFTLLASCLLADDKPNDTIIEQLQGRWEIVAGVNQGRKLTPSEVDGTYVTVTTNKITTFDRSSQQRYQAVFHIDESKKPIHIQMTTLRENTSIEKPSASDPHPESKAPGILQFVDKDTWQLCYSLSSTVRPEKFESPEGSKNMFFTLKKKPGAPVAGDPGSRPVEKK